MKEWVIRFFIGLSFLSVGIDIGIRTEPKKIIKDVKLVQYGCTEADSAFARLKREVASNRVSIYNYLNDTTYRGKNARNILIR